MTQRSSRAESTRGTERAEGLIHALKTTVGPHFTEKSEAIVRRFLDDMTPAPSAPADIVGHVPSQGYLVKLVRDGIPAMLGQPGTVTYERCGPEQRVDLLRRKLIEECAEYAVEPSLEELADVVAVVAALAQVAHGTVLDEVIDIADAKDHERGGFLHGTVMMATHPADSQPEGDPS